MSVKESRREVIESGSPLARHSTNQKKMKIGDEGAKRVAGMRGIVEVESAEAQGVPDDLRERLPLGAAFVDAVLPFMVDLARERIAQEHDLPIPQRIANIARDIRKIYKFAKERNLETEILVGDDRRFNLRENTSRYLGVFPYSLLFIELKKFRNWRFVPDSYTQAAIDWGKAYIANLTSCDFTLPPDELLAERVETYAYVLATIGLAIPDPGDRDRKVLTGNTFNMFSNVAERYFQHLKV